MSTELFIERNGSYVPFLNLSDFTHHPHPPTNATVAAVWQDTTYCITDPPPIPAYLCLAVIDLAAYLIPCVSRSTYPVVRCVLFALNLALFANVAFVLYVDPSYGISWLFIGCVAILGVVFYSLAMSWALFITLILAIGAAFFNAQPLAQEWINTLLGADLSMSVVNFLLFGLGCFTTVIFLLTLHSTFFEWLIDALVFSVLAQFAIQYLYFYYEDHNADTWAGSGFFPPADEVCCDDVYVMCPIWFTPSSAFTLVMLIVVRLAIVAVYEDLSTTERQKQEKEAKEKLKRQQLLQKLKPANTASDSAAIPLLAVRSN